MTPGTPSPDGRTPGEAGAEAESAPGGPALREVGPPPPTRPAAPDARSTADGSEPGDAGPAAAAPAGPGLAAAVRSILAALSCGALLAGAVVLTLACLWHSALPLSVGAGILRSLGARLIGILALWVVGVAILGRAPAGERARRSCAAGLIAAEICLTWCAVAAPRALWYELLATTTIPARHVLALAAAGACLGTAAIIDLLRRASAARPARGLHPARRAARRWRTILVVAFIDCLVCVLAAVLVVDGVVGLARAPRPDISTTTAAPLTLPARPEAVSGRAVWQRTASPEDLVVGAAGPILVEAGALRALDPADGSVLWSYERPGAELAPFSSTTGLLQNTGARAIVSPDGRHVAIHVTTEKSSLAHSDAAVIIVLDAVTGAVTARIASEALTPFQLTDAMGFDGTRAFALNGGQELWAFTEPPDRELMYSGTAGHEALITSITTEVESSAVPLVTLTLEHDGGRGHSVTLTHVLTDPVSGRLAIADDWVPRLAEDDAARALSDAGSLLDATTTGEEPAPLQLEWRAQAVRLDDIISDTIEPVDLGSGSGANAGATTASGDLCLMGARSSNALTDSHGSADLLRSSIVPVSVVLDTATGRAVIAQDDPGLGSAAVGSATDARSLGLASLVVRPGDGGAGVSIPAGPGPVDGAAGHLSSPMQQLTGTPAGEDVWALEAPGATLVLAPQAEGDAPDATPDAPTHIVYGVRNG